MQVTTFHNRAAVSVENESIRVTVMERGGHIASILDRSKNVSPLWIPPWTDEPSPDFGNNSESRLLEGIFGHNVCLDLFGPPSEPEAAAGVTAHAEASIGNYEFAQCEGGFIARCKLPSSQLSFERRIRLDGRRVLIDETVENLSVFDRPIAWTQHVTLGPPFLERGKTQFRIPATKSRAIGDTTDFDWPGPRNLETFTGEESSSGYTAHLMDPAQSNSYFVAWSPTLQLACAYAWQRTDFPWMGIWEENHSRTHSPWNGRTLTRGMEFGASPFPETRRQMIDRGTMFATPCYRWIEGSGKLRVRYWAAVAPCSSVPQDLRKFETLL